MDVAAACSPQAEYGRGALRAELHGNGPRAPRLSMTHMLRHAAPTPPAHPLSGSTRIVFCTEGILLRELAGDPLLSGYDVVVLDEVRGECVGLGVWVAVRVWVCGWVFWVGGWVGGGWIVVQER